MSHDVRLPKKRRPIFPDHCLQCRSKAPDNTVRVCAGAVGWWNFVFLTLGRKFCVDFPICSACKQKFQRQHHGRLFVTLVLAVAGALMAIEMLETYDGPYMLWIGSGIVAVVLIPIIFWELFWPPSFDITPYTRSVDYHFRNRADAEVFAARNGGKVE